MDNHKKVQPQWLKDLETGINNKLKKKFEDKGFNIKNLILEYNIVTPLSNEVQGKRLVLTDPVVATFDPHIKNGGEEKEAYALVSETISARLKAKGLW